MQIELAEHLSKIVLQLKVNITYKINCSTIRSEKIEIILLLLLRLLSGADLGIL